MSRAAQVPLSESQKVDFLQLVSRKMAELTFPFIEYVIGVQSPDVGRFCGSAWRLACGGGRFVVTAAHVVEEAAAGGGPAISSRNGIPPRLTPLSDWYRSSDADIAVWRVPDGDADDSSGVFWPERDVDESGARLGDDLLFVHGFPQRSSRFVRLLGGVVGSSLPYGAMELDEPGIRQALGPDRFAVHYEATHLRDGEGDVADFVVPRGLSGSAVWRSDVGGRAVSTWRPQLSRIVGMVTHWDQDRRALIALHARHVLAAVRRTA